MKMFAIIKDNKHIKIVNGDDISNIINTELKKEMYSFLEEIITRNNEDYIINKEDLNTINNNYLSESKYNAYNVLKNIIETKKRNEIKRLLTDLFSIYDIEKNLINYIINNISLDSFYVTNDNRTQYNKKEIGKLLRETFGFSISADLIKELDMLIKSQEYKLSYSAKELKEYILSTDEIIKINRNNFGELLYEFGEIPNPKIPTAKRHKCYDCEKLSPLTCEKAEYIKKRIDKYPFIISGYQIFITSDYKKNNMIDFTVEDCRDYVRSNNNIIDEEEYTYVKKMRKK